MDIIHTPPPFILEMIQKKTSNLVAESIDISEAIGLEDTETKIWCRGKSVSGLRGAVALKYHRVDIGYIFQGVTPEVHRSYQGDLVVALEEKYGVRLNADELDLVQEGPHAIRVCAKEGSYYYIGHFVVSVISGNMAAPRVTEKSSPKLKDAKEYSTRLSFLTLGTLSKVLDDKVESLKIPASALAMETLDPWKVTKTPNPYNLYGATFVSNGAHTYENKPEPLLLVIRLNPEHCTNMRGELKLFYSIPESEE